MGLTPEILTIYILDTLFIFFATIAFILSLKISFSWDVNAVSPRQYSLEKQSYLAATIIKYIFYIKVPLFLFFIFTLDGISTVLPGAMCGAGVVNASEYATPLLFLKIVNIYLFSYWIVLDREDLKIESQPYLKQKFIMYTVLYILLLAEILFEVLLFRGLDIQSVVDCCGVIFSQNEGSYIASVLALKSSVLLLLFYGNFILLIISRFFKQKHMFAIFNFTFIFMGLIALIAFFGTYIYELPTHHCPFCLLQVEYNYVGYLLYGVLFIGTFNGLLLGFIEFDKVTLQKRYRLSLVMSTLFVVIVSLYPIIYFFNNGVWL